MLKSSSRFGWKSGQPTLLIIVLLKHTVVVRVLLEIPSSAFLLELENFY